MREHIDFWELIGADEFIRTCIYEGYKIPFYTTPPSNFSANNQSAIKHKDFVEEAIKELLSKKCVIETGKPYSVNPLTVAVQGNGKKRLILDLRNINKHLYKFPVKYEGLNELKNYVCEDGFLVNFDLKSGYHHLDMFPDHQKYLGFAWKMNGVIKFYKFTVLPFGLSSACNIFTKLLRPLVKYWRSRSIKIIMYLDDGIITNDDKTSLEIEANRVKSDLGRAGFLINEEKSNWNPEQKIVWLGFNIDLNLFQFSIPSQKSKKFLEELSLSLMKRDISARDLARICGKITAFEPAVGRYSKLMTKKCLQAVVKSKDWDSRFQVDENCRVELNYWRNNLLRLNGVRILKENTVIDKTLFTDASGQGGGGYIKEDQAKAHFIWSDQEASESSTHREIRALVYCLKSFASFLRGKSLKWFTDSRNGANIVNYGSMNPSLHDLALDVSVICQDLNIIIVPEWIPRNLNVLADSLSKIKSSDDWIVNEDIFKLYNNKWGPFNMDIFASNRNTNVKTSIRYIGVQDLWEQVVSRKIGKILTVG